MAGPDAGFTFDAAQPRIVFGPGAAHSRLDREVELLGCGRLLVFAGERDAGLIDSLLAPLEGRVADRFTHLRSHVSQAHADLAREATARARADGLLAIGGGAATGAAKAVALTTGLPIIAVPTTYAGSEVTPVWGITDGGVKRTGRDPRVLPRVVVYDPRLTFSLPAAVSAASGMNAMAHAVEAFWAPGANPISAVLAAEGVAALGRSLPGVVADGRDQDARSGALFGAYLAAAAFAVTGSGLHHKICHALGGAFDLPHAPTHAVVLPHVLAFNVPVAVEAASRIAAALGAAEAVKAVVDLATRLDTPAGLRDLGLPEAATDAVVDQILSSLPLGNPRPVGREDLSRLLRSAWRGRPEV